MVIRNLAPDELVWFLNRVLAFQGHADPMGLAQRLQPLLRDPRRDAGLAFVLLSEGETPQAGAVVRAPDPDDDQQNLILSQLWYGRPEALEQLLRELFARFPHEAAYAPLHGLLEPTVAQLAAVLEPLGFRRDRVCDLRFDLAEVPPIGTPLVLEAWSEAAEAEFRDTYGRAEGELGDAAWAWLKRWRGRFSPDLWFLARETLDQDAVGYAFCGASEAAGVSVVDAGYYLTAAGVVADRRDSSAMLRRLVVSLLQELSARSPLGSIETTLSVRDPKLIDILRSLGFLRLEEYGVFVRTPR